MSKEDEEAETLRKKTARLEQEQRAFEAQSKVYAQQQAAAEAQTKMIAAQTALRNAQLPTLAGPPTGGSVTADTGAGGGESSLLAARVIASIAEKIAIAVKSLPTTTQAATDTSKPQPQHRFIIFAGAKRPDFGHANACDVLSGSIKSALDQAGALLDEADTLAAKLSAAGPQSPPNDGATEAASAPKTGAAETGAAVASVATLFDLGVKLGSYFLTDYKTSAVAVAGVNDDYLAVAVAGQLDEAWYPARWLPPPQLKNLADLLDRINLPQRDLASRIEPARAWVQQLDDQIAAETDASRKRKLEQVKAAYERGLDAATLAQKLFDDFYKSLMVTDADGVTLLSRVLEEKTILAALDSGSLALQVQVNGTVGTTYTKRNAWTFLGAMPFFVRGGVTASYLVFQPQTGDILKAGQFAEESKFFKLHQIDNPATT